jgi:putative hemolysin
MFLGKIVNLWIALGFVLIVTGCSVVRETDEPIGLPNPASVYCEEQGGRDEIRTDDRGGQYGMCVFEDGSECEEWAYFRGECEPGSSNQDSLPVPTPRYVNEAFGFSFDPPAEWAVESQADYLLFTRPGYKFFVGFQVAGEELIPFRTGMPQGDFVEAGTAMLLGQAIPKQNLVAEGKTRVVAYSGRIQAGDLILVMYLDAVETDEVSYGELDIPQEIIDEADQIIASFAFTSGEIPVLEFSQ